MENEDIHPQDKIDMYRIKGVSNQRIGNRKAAISDYSKIIDIDSENYFAWHSRGSMKYKTGDMDGALEDAKKAVELDSSHEKSQKLLDAVKRKKKDS